MEKIQPDMLQDEKLLTETKLTTAVLFLSGISVISSLYMIIPLLPFIANEYEVTMQQAAWAGSIFPVFFAIGCLFFGAVAERIGLKNVLVGGMIGLSIVTLFVGNANTFTQLLFLRALQGAIAATFSPPSITYIGVMFPPSKRLSTIGLVTSGFLMSGVIGQIISSFMAVYTEWQTVFYLFSAIYILAAILLFRILKKDDNSPNKTFLTVVKQFRLPLQNPSLRASFCIGITLLLSFIGMYTALENYLMSHFGYSAKEILYIRAAGIFGIILAPFAGMFANRFGIKNVLFTGFISAVIGLIGLGFSKIPFLSVVMSVVFVAGIALIIPTMLALAGKLGGKQRGPATAVYTFFMFSGASIGPIAATLALQTGLANLPFFIFAVVLLFGLFMIQCIQFPKKT